MQQGPQRQVFVCELVPTPGEEVTRPGWEAEDGLRLRGSELRACARGGGEAGGPWPVRPSRLREYRIHARGRKRGAGKGAVRRGHLAFVPAVPVGTAQT